MTDSSAVRRQDFLGIFLVTMATLMFQIILTRIFSVAMWYHFAFVAISVSMFGFTVGALLVHRFPDYFTVEKTHYHMALSSVAFGVLILFAFMTQQSIPFMTDISDSIIAPYSIVLIYLVLSLPYIGSGICVCLTLTRFPAQVGKLYCADLIGSAAGCLLVIPVLRLTDAPTAVVLTAVVPCLAALAFAWSRGFSKLRNLTCVASLCLVALAWYNVAMAENHPQPLRLRWVMGKIEGESLKEYWNEYSRVIIRGNPDAGPSKPQVHGLSKNYRGEDGVSQMMIVIDVIGATHITNIHGDEANAEYLKHVVTNVVHVLRPDSDVLVVGVGGGRDILSALTFDQKSVTGVEINDSVVRMLTEDYASYAGNLHEDPRVNIVLDEGRSYITRQDEDFDIIQLSFIDTFAAGSAGAFVLTENALYTVEAFEEYIGHLSERGVFSVSHYYFRDLPIQVYRLTSLAYQALRNMGIESPKNHIAILRHPEGWEFNTGIDFDTGDLGYDDVATLLVSRVPFTEADIDQMESFAREHAFEMILSPRGAGSIEFAKLAVGQRLEELEESLPVILDPPTDDAPFFFHSLSFSGLFDDRMAKQGLLSVNTRAIRVLAYLFMFVVLFATLCVIGPFVSLRRQGPVPGLVPSLGFFLAIGLGYMLVEMAVMQRLMIFLGFPTYALAVVLFTLLLTSGLGSWSTQLIRPEALRKNGMTRLVILLVIIVLVQMVVPEMLRFFRGSTTPIRLLIAVLIIAPQGFFMGMAYPMGLSVLSEKHEEWAPLMWATNGAASVCGSVLAVAISLGTSITGTYWAAYACYLLAVACFFMLPKGTDSTYSKVTT